MKVYYAKSIKPYTYDFHFPISTASSLTLYFTDSQNKQRTYSIGDVTRSGSVATVPLFDLSVGFDGGAVNLGPAYVQGFVHNAAGVAEHTKSGPIETFQIEPSLGNF